MTLTRRALSTAAALFGAFALAACGGGDGAADGRSAFERADDRAKGSPDAPVTIIEYASTACPGCAAFHELSMPTVEEYIDSGDVRFVFREMITGQPNLAIAGFMLARCAGDERYFDVLELLFDQQRALLTAMQQGRAQAQFQAIARSVGFNDAEFQACMTNEETLAEVQDASRQASADGIGSTPTFIVNGEQLELGSAPEVQGAVWTVNGQPLVDDQGPIPALYDGDSMARIILYYKARAEGSAANASDGGAG